MKKYFVLAFFGLGFLFLAGCGNKENEEAVVFFENTTELVASVKPEVEMISLLDFKTLYDSGDPVVIIDVRTVPEHNAGFIPYSISIPRGVLEFRIGKERVWDAEGMYPPVKEDLIIVYCKSGNRAVLAAKAIQDFGYTNVKWLEGSWLKWKENYPDMYETSIPDGAEAVAADEGGR